MRLSDIVGDIIELSSLDEGYKGEIEKINVRNVVGYEIKKLEHKAEDNGVSIENNVSSSLVFFFSSMKSNVDEVRKRNKEP